MLMTPTFPPPVWGKSRLPLLTVRSPTSTVCVAWKWFADASCGTLVVSRFKVTLPLVPWPVRSVPPNTPVIVPEPALLHTHVLPLHCNIWLAAQVWVRVRLVLPLVPPPVSPLPLAVDTPVIVPVPGKGCPLRKLGKPLWLT